MKTLEATLSEIQELRIGLSAETVVQEGRRHYEGGKLIGFEGGSRYGTWQGREICSEGGFVTDQLRIAHPDKEKQADSRKRLQEVYQASEWYSARYEAGCALRVSDKELDKNIDLWIGELRKRVNATKIEEVMVTKSVDYSFDASGTHYVDDTSPEPMRVPDLETRRTTREDLRYLYKNLPSKTQRSQAGRALNYFRLRIWFTNGFLR